MVLSSKGRIGIHVIFEEGEDGVCCLFVRCLDDDWVIVAPPYMELDCFTLSLFYTGALYQVCKLVQLPLL